MQLHSFGLLQLLFGVIFSFYWLIFNLAKCYCSIRVPAYPDLALDVIELGLTLTFTQIPLYCCKGFLCWLLQLQTDFQFTSLSGCIITNTSIQKNRNFQQISIFLSIYYHPYLVENPNIFCILEVFCKYYLDW